MNQKKFSYFLNLNNAPKLNQMPQLETIILAGPRGEKMMMALNKTKVGAPFLYIPILIS